jgi:hypothetical protein
MAIKFYTKGVANLRPGNLTESGSRQRAFLHSLPATSATIGNLVFTTYFALNFTNTFTYTNPATGAFQQASVVVGAVLDPRTIIAQLSQQISSVSFNQISSNAMNIVANEFGSTGNFTININGNILNGAVTTNLIIPAGRIVVPESNDLTFINKTGDRTPRYRLPQLSDNATQLEFCLLTMFDHGSNLIRNILNPSGGQTPGSVRAGLESGTMVLDPVQPVIGNSLLFVETISSGINNAGRITSSPTGTTIPLPNGKLFVKSGTTQIGQLAEVRIKQ